MRKFLKDRSEFRGWSKTGMLVLKEHKKGTMKGKALALMLIKIYMLSEDYESDDSDSSDSDDSDRQEKPTRKSVISILKKEGKLKLDGKKFSL